MKYLDLNDIKKHLYIDDECDVDDDILKLYGDIAEEIVEKDLDEDIDSIIESNGGIPKPIYGSMLIMVGNLYANRESVSYSSVNEVPKSYDYLLQYYHNFKNSKM